MNWYIPSWNGDFRFEPYPPDNARSVLNTEKPTPMEKEALRRWAKIAVKKKWTEPLDDEQLFGSKPIILSAPVGDAAAVMAKILNHKRAGVLTCFKFASGKVEATEVIKLPRWARKIEEQLVKDEVTEAVTVSRPSLSCPECRGRPEGERKACDVLWKFLDPTQRKEWRRGRSFHVVGGLTRHVYRVSSRDTERARIVGRCVIDESDDVVLHNYNWTVPPEEEVLADKLILEHRENWLRVFGEVDPIDRARCVFQNPFKGQALLGY